MYKFKIQKSGLSWHWVACFIASIAFITISCSSSQESQSGNDLSSNSSQDCASIPLALEKPSSQKNTTVTKANYALAETQVIFSDYIKKIAKATCSNGVGKMMYLSTAADPKDKTIVRANFDTLYAFAVLDLSSPAQLVLPDNDGRYQSAWIISENHYNPYGINKPGSYTITRENVGEQYAMVIIRTQVNMKSKDDLKEANTLAREIKLSQKDSGSYKVSNNWDMKEILAVRKSYQELQKKDVVSAQLLFGKRGELTQSRHNLGVAMGWGGFTKEQAIYEQYSSKSSQPQKLVLKKVPIAKNGFWSLTIYGSDGYPVGENFNINSSFAATQKDGSVILSLGGDKKAENYLEIYDGWTAVLRMYMPTDKYFNKSWKRPELQKQGSQGSDAVSYQD
jgi:hypothetical protein